jgi:hypothetical protein
MAKLRHTERASPGVHGAALSGVLPVGQRCDGAVLFAPRRTVYTAFDHGIVPRHESKSYPDKFTVRLHRD